MRGMVARTPELARQPRVPMKRVAKHQRHGTMMRFLSTVLLGLLVGSASIAAPVLRDGDLIFQSSRSGQSLAVQRATHSPWSHMGVVLMRGGKPFVLEASATVRY